MNIIKQKNNRKAQMEMMGLIMVVILLIFGLLIYVRIQVSSAEKDSENVDDSFMVDMSSKVLKVMLHTTSSCSNLDGRQLISDLASNSINVGGSCTYTNLVKCNGGTSEITLFGSESRPYYDGSEGFVQKILENSLKEEALLNYTLKIQMKGTTKNPGCILYKSKVDECKDVKASYQGEFIFDSDKGKVVATLTVC